MLVNLTSDRLQIIITLVNPDLVHSHALSVSSQYSFNINSALCIYHKWEAESKTERPINGQLDEC